MQEYTSNPMDRHVPALDLNKVGRQLQKDLGGPLLTQYDDPDPYFSQQHKRTGFAPHHSSSTYASAATYRPYPNAGGKQGWGQQQGQQQPAVRHAGGYRANHLPDSTPATTAAGGWATARPAPATAVSTYQSDASDFAVHGHHAQAWHAPAHQRRHDMPMPKPLVAATQGMTTTYSPPGQEYASPTSSAISSSTTFHAGLSGGGAGSCTPKSRPMGGLSGASPLPSCGTPPLTAAAAVRQYLGLLTEYEQAEIFDYRHVYFLGQGAKKVCGSPAAPASNYGYDDDKGDYKVVTRDHVAFRYEVLSVLGKGSFGQVMHCTDHKTGGSVALKVIRNKKRFHSQAVVEVEILQRLAEQGACEAAHVVRMRDHFHFRGHLCIAFDLLGLNLYDHLKARDFSGLPLHAVRRVSLQVLEAMSFLRRQRVVHCDIKPENVLLNATGSGANTSYDVTLIDFGSSCYEGRTMYTYIQSRFYRAPEVILGLRYGPPIDVWSLACVLAELLTGYPLFPGDDEHQQLLCIMEVLGLPPRHMLEAAPRAAQFFDPLGLPLVVPNSRGLRRYPGSQDLASAVGCADPQLLSFLRACLQWDPAARLTPEQAMQHPFIAAGRALVQTPPAAAAAAAPVAQPPATHRPYRPPGVAAAAAAGGQQQQLAHKLHGGNGSSHVGYGLPRKVAVGGGGPKPQGAVKKAQPVEPAKRLRAQGVQLSPIAAACQQPGMSTTSYYHHHQQQQQQQQGALPDAYAPPQQQQTPRHYHLQQQPQQQPSVTAQYGLTTTGGGGGMSTASQQQHHQQLYGVSGTAATSQAYGAPSLSQYSIALPVINR